MPSPSRRLLPPARSLAADLSRQQLGAAAKKIAGLTRQLAFTVAALDRSRSTRRVRFSAGAARTRLKGDHIRVILPDTHGASVNRPALAAALADLKALDPHEIILLGDHVDCGGFLAQHHTLGYVAQTSYSYEEDISAARAFLDSVRAAAPRATVEYLEGNHERRVETWCVTQTLRHAQDSEMLRRAFAPEFLLDLAGRGIRYYRLGEFYDGLPVPGVIKRGKCFFFHGITTAKHAASVTQIRVAGNCVFGHIHREQGERTRRLNVGEVGVWSPGCLCELQPLWNHGAPTDWTHGIAVQFVTRTGTFLHLNVPIISGQSLFSSLLKH